ncbi:MAG: hypothetical protein NT123_24365 [Proteobacteria bacterium]|nr:hypothetical protein [Pseudomonadota bacterium]
MHIDELKPGTYFKSDDTSFLYDWSRHITRCWDGGRSDAGFRAYPNISIEVISAERAIQMARAALQYACLE